AHLIEASAPGKLPWSQTVTLAPDGATATVSIPPLADAPQPPPDQRTPLASGDVGTTQRTIGIITAAVGGAGLLVGTITGVLAINKEKDSRDACSTQICGDPAGIQANDDARSLARVSTIAFVAGGAAVVAGGVLWLTAPRARTTTVGI